MTRTADIREAENRGLEKAAALHEAWTDDDIRHADKWDCDGKVELARQWRGNAAQHKQHAAAIRAMQEET